MTYEYEKGINIFFVIPHLGFVALSNFSGSLKPPRPFLAFYIFFKFLPKRVLRVGLEP